MHKILSILIVLLTITLCCETTIGQEIFDTKVIELSDGLNERIVNKIQRDVDGYFYIKTENYIQRWDGSTFVDIDASSLESLALLKSNTQLEILKDSTIILLESGKTGGDVYAIDAVKKSMYKIAPTWNENDCVIFSAGHLYTISYLNDDTTVISQLDRNFSPTHIAKINKGIHITSIANMKDRLIFNDQALNVYSYIYGTQSLIKSNLKGQLKSSPLGNVILANNDHIYHYNNGYFTVVSSVQELHKDNRSKNNLQALKLVHLDYDKKGSIAVGYTDSDRHIRKLEIVDFDGNVINRDAICKPNDRINDIYADDYADKYLLATYNGIYYHQLSGRGIKVSLQESLDHKSDFGQIISTLTSDNKGNVYLCSEGSGLYQYDSISNTGIELIKNDKYFKGNLKLYYDSLDNKLWSVGYNSASSSDLFSYDLTTKKAKKYPLEFLANDFIRENEKNILLIGRRNIKKNNGQFERHPKIARFNLQNHNLEYIHLLDSTKFDLPRNLFIYKDYMMIGTTDGLVISDNSMSNILKVIDEESTKESIDLRANWIVFVKPFHNLLMVGTNGDGVFLMDPKTFECVNKINKNNGLSDNVAVSMEVDPYGNAWLTSFNGINIIDSNLNVIRTVYEHDGLSHREFSSLANITSNGSFYFGTNNGVSIIDPVEYFKRKSSIGLVIKDIEVTNRNSEIIKHLGHVSNIKVDEESSEIIINVSLPDYYDYNVGNISSELSIDQGLKYIIKDKQIIISDPKRGIYPIVISNSFNANKKQVTLDISQNYPWIQILSILGVIIGSYLISLFFIKKNRTQESDKTQYNKKIAELKLNALKAQMNPHFIFNSLGAIQYFIQTQDTGKADEYLSKFAKLMRLILESSKSDYINIKDEMELMELYADLEYIRFEGLFDYVVQIDDDVDTDLPLPPMIVQPLVENAINHGLYNLKNRKGLLEILTTSSKNDQIKIVIRDNGVGRRFQSQSKKPNHKSRGMDILNERISIINNHNDMHVDLKINDLDQTSMKNGTEVTIEIKYFS